MQAVDCNDSEWVTHWAWFAVSCVQFFCRFYTVWMWSLQLVPSYNLVNEWYALNAYKMLTHSFMKQGGISKYLWHLFTKSRRHPAKQAKSFWSSSTQCALHLQLEKHRALQDKNQAEEQNRQIQAQAQSLIESNARIRAENAALGRSHRDAYARVELLEQMYHTSDRDASAMSGKEEWQSPTLFSTHNPRMMKGLLSMF